jgi:hypothetical protein
MRRLLSLQKASLVLLGLSLTASAQDAKKPLTTKTKEEKASVVSSPTAPSPAPVDTKSVYARDPGIENSLPRLPTAKPVAPHPDAGS